VEDMRAKTDQVVNRLRSEAGFLDQVRRDPENVLRQAGLPEELVGDFAHGVSDDDVHGLQYCKWTCVKATSECTRSYLV
jgi:hypothetical protein